MQSVTYARPTRTSSLLLSSSVLLLSSSSSENIRLAQPPPTLLLFPPPAGRRRGGAEDDLSFLAALPVLLPLPCINSSRRRFAFARSIAVFGRTPLPSSAESSQSSDERSIVEAVDGREGAGDATLSRGLSFPIFSSCVGRTEEQESVVRRIRGREAMDEIPHLRYLLLAIRATTCCV